MSITRRLFASAMPAAPFAAKQAISQAAWVLPGANGAKALGPGDPSWVGASPNPPDNMNPTPIKENMPWGDARKLLFNNKDFQQELYEKAFAYTKYNTQSLDADLVINKSFSLTTKVLIQRERNARARVASSLSDHDKDDIWSMVTNKISKLVYG